MIVQNCNFIVTQSDARRMSDEFIRECIVYMLNSRWRINETKILYIFENTQGIVLQYTRAFNAHKILLRSPLYSLIL